MSVSIAQQRLIAKFNKLSEFFKQLPYIFYWRVSECQFAPAE